MQKLYKNLLERFVLCVVFVCGLSLLASAQSITITPTSPTCVGGDAVYTITITGGIATYEFYYDLGSGTQFVAIPDNNPFIVNLGPIVSDVNLEPIEVRDNNGTTQLLDLTADPVVTIIAQALPTASFEMPTAYEQCEGTSTDLLLSITGTGNITVDIQDNLANPAVPNVFMQGNGLISTVSPPSDATFTITNVVDDLGCIGANGATATIDVKDTIKVTIAAPDTVCTAEAVSITYTITGDPLGTYDVNYQENGSILSQSGIGNSFSGNYPGGLTGPVSNFHIDLIKYATGLGCDVSDAADSNTVVNPIPTATFDVPTGYEQCAGTSTDLAYTLTGTGNITLTIKDDLGNTLVTNTQLAGVYNVTATPTANRTYTVTAVQDDHGCVGSTGSATSVTVKDSLKVAIAAPDTICADQINIQIDYTITGSAGPYDIFYQANGSPTSVSGIGANFSDNYISLPPPSANFHVDSVRYNTGLGCVMLNVADTTIIVNPLPTATFDVPTGYEQCAGTFTDLAYTLSGNGNITFTIKDDEGNTLVTNTLPAGSYNVTATPTANRTYTFTAVQDDHGCVGSTGSATSVTIKDSLKVTIAAPDTICANETGIQIDYTITGSAGSYDIFYKVDGSDSTKLGITGSFSDIYASLSSPSVNFHVDSIKYSTGLSCVMLNGADTTTIVNPLPTAVFASSIIEQCEGTTSSVQLDLTGSGTLSYSVTDNSGASFAIGTGTSGPVSLLSGPLTGDTSYIVTSIIDDHGCIGTDSSTVNVIVKDSITASIVAPGQVCEGTTVPVQYNIAGDGAPYNVYYSVNSGDSTKMGSAITFTDTYSPLTGNTLFTVDSVEYASGAGCKQKDLASASVAVIALPTVDLVEVIDTVCNGTPVDLNFTVNGGGTITVRYKSGTGSLGTVSGSAGTLIAPVVPPLGNSIYFVDSVWSTSGIASCTNTFTSDTTRIHVKEKPTVSITPNVSTVCQGEQVLFTTVVSGSPDAAAQGNFKLRMKFGAVDTTFGRPLGTSVFSWTFTNTSTVELVSIADSSLPTCQTNYGTAQVISVTPKATAVFDGNKTICEGQSANLGINFTGSGPYSFVVNGIPYSSSDDTTIAVTPANDSIFTITEIIDATGCIASTNISVTVFVHNKPQVTFDLSADKVCKGNNVSLIDTITGGTGNFALYFSGEASLFNPTGVPNGRSSFSRIINTTTTYTLDSIRDNSVPTACYFPIGISRTVQAIDYPTASVSVTDNTICEGTPADLQFTITGAGVDTLWYKGSDGFVGSVFGAAPLLTASPVPTITGNVTYSIDSIIEGSGAGCKSYPVSSIAIIVTPTPTATVDGGKPVCESNTVPLELYFTTTGEGTITVDYQDNYGNSYTYSTPVARTNDTVPLSITQAPGNLTFTITGVTSSVTGAICPGLGGSSTTFSVTDSPEGTVTSNQTNIVAGGTSTLVFGVDGVGPFDLVYTDGSTIDTLKNLTLAGISKDVSPIVTTTYTILNVIDKGTAPRPCESGPLGDITILVTNQVAAISGNATICLGESFPAYLSFQGDGLYDVTVSDGGANSQSFTGKKDQDLIYITPSTTGTIHYKITQVTDEFNNTSADTYGEAIVNVVQQKTVNIAGIDTICEGQSSNLVFSLSGTGTFTVTYTNLQTGIDYTFSATAANSPITRSVTAGMLVNGTNNFTIKSVSNSNPSSVCPIVSSGSGAITVKPTPAVTLSIDPNPTCQNSSATLKLDFATAGPYDVVLVTDSVSPIRIDTLRNIGNYTMPIVATRNMTFTVTDVWYSTGNLCTNTTNQSVQLKVNTSPTASIMNNTNICEGGSAPIRFVLNGKLPLTVNYTDGVTSTTFTVFNTLDTTIQVTPTSTKTYVINSVSDANNPSCSASGNGSATVTVVPKPNVSLDLSQDSICAQQTARLKFTCSGVPPFAISYLENGNPRSFTATSVGQSELIVNPSATTTYTLVKVVDGSGLGCERSLSGSKTLTILPLPNAVITTQTPEVCEGTSVKIRLNLTGTGNITTRIRNNTSSFDTLITSPAGLMFFNVTPAVGTHTYTVISVTDESSYACTRTNASSLTIKVNQKPTATLTSSSQVCEGSNVILEFDVVGSGLMTVNYANDQGGLGSFTTSGGFTSLSVDPYPATGVIKYFITSIESQNGVVCTGVSTDTATVLVSPNPVVGISSTQKTICKDDCTQLKFSVTGNGPFLVNYTDGITMFTIVVDSDSDGDGIKDKYVTVCPSQTTTFRVTSVTDNSSPTCSNNSTVAYTVIVNQRPTASISGNGVICEGDATTLTFVLSGRAPLTLVYSGDNATHTITGLQPGTLVLDTVRPHAPGANYSIVSITDANAPACSSPGQGSAAILVNTRPQGTINTTPNPICKGGNSTLLIGITGGVAPYQVVYSKGSVLDTVIANGNSLSISVSPTVTTTYSLVSITDNSSTKCQTLFNNVSSTLVVNDVPSATVDVMPTTVCEGTAVQLTFKAKGGNSITIYYDLNGVNQAPVTLTTDNDNDGFLDKTISSIPTVPSSGIMANYAIRYAEVDATLCTGGGGDSAYVQVNPAPTAAVLSTNPSTVCFGDTSKIAFQVSGAGTVTVVFDQISATGTKRDSVSGSTNTLYFPAVPFENTTYQIVSVRSDSNGVVCNGNITSPAFQTVTVNARPTIDFTLQKNPICAGEQTMVTFDFPVGVAPFDVEYVVVTKGMEADADTVVVNNIVSGNTFSVGPFQDTTIIYAYSITDNGTPGCVSKDSVGIQLNVNPLASVKISGDSVFCVNQQEGFYVDVIGVGNVSFRYKTTDNTFFSGTISRPAGRHFINVNQALGVKNYVLVAGSLGDQSSPSCLGSLSGSARVTVIPAPTANLTNVTTICEGEVSTITVQLTGGGNDSITVYYHDNFNNTYTYRNKPGLYDVLLTPSDSSIYTPDSVKYKSIGCPGLVSGTAKINVRPTPEGSIGLASDICKGDTATAVFNMDFGGPFDLTYQIGTSSPVVVNSVNSGYSVKFKPTANTTVFIKQIVYSDIPLCTALNVASATIAVNDSLKVIASNKVCDSINSAFSFDLSISGGKPGTYTYNGTTPIGSSYTTPRFGNGRYTFTIADGSGCPGVVFDDIDTCACTNKAPNMTITAPTLLDPCEDEIKLLSHDGTEIYDANDSLFFIFTDVIFNGKFGTVYGNPSDNPTAAFVGAGANIMEYEKMYYRVPVMSDYDPVTKFSANDRCLKLGEPTPFVFHQNTKLSIDSLYSQTNDSGAVCKGDELWARFTILGKHTGGPYELVVDTGGGPFTIILQNNGPENRTYYRRILTSVTGATAGFKVISFKDQSLTDFCERVLDADSAVSIPVRNLPNVTFGVSDDKVCVGEGVVFTPSNTSLTDGYYWWFDDGMTAEVRQPTHAYTLPRTFYNAYLVVTNQYGCKDTGNVRQISVQSIPAPIIISDSVGIHCYEGPTNTLTFADSTVYNPVGTRQWFVNGGGSGSGNPLVRTFTTKGLNTIVLAYTSTNGCVGYDTVVVKIEGPTANLDTVSVKPCIGEFYTFNLSDTVDVNKDLILFQFGPGIAEERGKLFANRRFPSNPNYPDPRYNQVKVTLESDNGCKHVINQEILLFETRAEFDINPVGAPIADSSHCFGTKVNFQNATGTNVTVPPTTITSWNWDFGIGSGIPPQYEQNLPTDSFVFAMPVLPDTTFEVTLIATNNRGCVDTVKHITEIYPLPSLSSNSFANCPGEADTLVVRNSFPDRYRYGTQFDWTYSDHITDSIFTDTSAAARIAIKSNSLDTTIIFNLTATNSKGCINTFSKSIDFHNLQAPDDQLLHDLSATYVIGYTYGLDTVENFNADQEDNRWVYNWEPLEDISCGNCPEPVISTMEDRTYTLTVADIYGCYNRQIYVSIDIEGKESLDVPGGFTPNEDGVNDVIYPDGHAIKEIVEFTVFNRFGNIVHSASGKIADVGWDGKIGGKVQTQDVYSYVVTANTYTGKTLVKRGKFSLIR